MEKEMATHSGILAWRIPWTEEPGGLQSMGSQKVGYDWSDLACKAILSFPRFQKFYTVLSQASWGCCRVFWPWESWLPLHLWKLLHSAGKVEWLGLTSLSHDFFIDFSFCPMCFSGSRFHDKRGEIVKKRCLSGKLTSEYPVVKGQPSPS